jgi:transitional endoplasmic reticulum ATPase
VLTVRSTVEREVHCRVDESGGDEPEDSTLVRLGRLLWTQLVAKPGDRLELKRAGRLRQADKVHVRPAFHLSHNLGHRLADRLRADGAVVWDRAMLFAPVFAGGGGVVVRVHSVDAADAGPAIVGPDTEFLFEEPDPDIARRRVTLAEVGGLDDAVERLRDLIETPLLRPGLFRSLGVRPPKGVLLHGPPGTGKTLLSRAVAEELGANVMKLPATELVGTYSGETEANLRSLFNEASHHAPTIIVIDEIDVITTSRGRLASQGDIRATTQLLTLMDGLEEVDGVVLLATTNRVEAIDEAFRRPGRFDEEIYIGPPDVAARREILSIHTREVPLAARTEELLAEIAQSRTAGFTGADLMHLVREAGLAAARRLSGAGAGVEVAEQVHNQDLAVEPEDVRVALEKVSPSALRGLPVVEKDLGWADLLGLDDQQRALLDAAAAALGSGPGRREGVLLSGPSGNGKSALVHALATEVGANVVVVDGSTIFTQWLGESEAALRALFRKAHDVAPSVVVLEHLDAIAPRRVAGHVESASSRVLSALLSSVDEALRGKGILVVGVTDRPDLIDPALTRAGRLGLHLEVGLPDDARRRMLIDRALDGSDREHDVRGLVAETAGQTAAELDRMLRRRTRSGRSSMDPPDR